MRKEKDNKKCWEVESTLCNHPGVELLRANSSGSKKEACIRLGCIYYKTSQGLSLSGLNL